MELLASIVNNRIATTRTPIQLAQQRRFVAVTPKDIWLWIAQRIDISLNAKLNIDRAYESVRTAMPKSRLVRQLTLIFSLRLTQANGFRNIDSS
jgi:hypothetical protein